MATATTARQTGLAPTDSEDEIIDGDFRSPCLRWELYSSLVATGRRESSFCCGRQTIATCLRTVFSGSPYGKFGVDDTPQ